MIIGSDKERGSRLNEDIKKENEFKKEFLLGYKIAKLDVRRLEEQLAELQASKLSPSCMIGDGMPHAHEPSDLSVYAALVDELEGRLKRARYNKVRAFSNIEKCIETLESEQEKILLRYRYLKLMNWYEIAERMSTSYRHVLRIHGNALKNITIIDV